jgi:hypothetical protein
VRNGINLSSRPRRAADLPPGLSWIPVLALAALAVVHVTVAYRARQAVGGLRQSVREQEARLDELTRTLISHRGNLQSKDNLETLKHLAAFDLSGAPDAVPTARLVREVAAALPDGARLRSLDLKLPSGRAELVLDVVADEEGAPSLLIRALRESEMFGEAEVLDERAAPGGVGLEFRLTARVRSEARPR